MSESHIRIKNEFTRNPEYIKFDKRVKSTVYRFLQAHIIRESKSVKKYTFGAQYIYREYFLKGMLVSRYSQTNMAQYLQTKQPRLNRYLKELEQDGFIKIIKIKASSGPLCYYQLGTWKGKVGEPSYAENIWHDEIFSQIIQNRKDKKENEIEEQFDEVLDEIYGENFDSYFITV